MCKSCPLLSFYDFVCPFLHTLSLSLSLLSQPLYLSLPSLPLFILTLLLLQFTHFLSIFISFPLLQISENPNSHPRLEAYFLRGMLFGSRPIGHNICIFMHTFVSVITMLGVGPGFIPPNFQLPCNCNPPLSPAAGYIGIIITYQQQQQQYIFGCVCAFI